MLFSYDERAGVDILKVDGDNFRHLFLSRRSKESEKFFFRNLRDSFLYEYKVESIGKKEALMRLVGSAKDKEISNQKSEIAWCVVDPKTVEKTLPLLNEIGVNRLSFVYADRSQKNFKLDMERINRILINSCCQCGRTSIMKISLFRNLNEFCSATKEFYVFDFGGEDIDSREKGVFLIGPEGGFSESEKTLLRQKAKKTLSFKTNNILRSETAVVAAASIFII